MVKPECRIVLVLRQEAGFQLDRPQWLVEECAWAGRESSNTGKPPTLRVWSL
jgi:hypothetical protein